MATKTCKRLGCGKEYDSSSASGCVFHSGWPSFRDGQKTWTCCDKRSTDWEDFMVIPGCSNGSHSDEKPVRPTPNTNTSDQNDFAPQQIVAPVPPAIESVPKVEATFPQVPWISPAGKFKCRHIGCQVEYVEEDNADGACDYHPGNAMFKDTRKYWSCCGASSYDWDSFLSLPKCANGRHEPKTVDLKE